MALDRWIAEHLAAVGTGVAAVVLAMASVVVVPETEQAVVLNMGRPVRVINRFDPRQDFGRSGAGLAWRVPFVEEVVRVDRRILTVEMERQQVLSSDQQRLEVDAYARFRIIDPVKLVRTAGTVEQVSEQLQPILTSTMRQGLATHPLQSLLTPERGAVMGEITKALDREARAYGAQVLDVRIESADLPAGTPLEAAYTRMQAARIQEATTIRAEGQRRALVVEAEAQAEAARIYAASFGKDPGFFDFYRAMKSYETSFATPGNKGSTTIVLSPGDDYLRQFANGARGGGK